MDLKEGIDLGFNGLGMNCEIKQNGFLKKFGELKPHGIQHLGDIGI